MLLCFKCNCILITKNGPSAEILTIYSSPTQRPGSENTVCKKKLLCFPCIQLGCGKGHMFGFNIVRNQIIPKPPTPVNHNIGRDISILFTPKSIPLRVGSICRTESWPYLHIKLLENIPNKHNNFRKKSLSVSGHIYPLKEEHLTLCLNGQESKASYSPFMTTKNREMWVPLPTPSPFR